MATVENFSLRDLYSRTSGNLTGVNGTLASSDLIFITVGTGTANVSSVAVTLNEHLAYVNQNSQLDSIYSTLTSNSGNWNNAFNQVATVSGRWMSTWMTVTANSANWDSAYSNLPSGTTNKVPKFTSSNQLGDSTITENAKGYTEFSQPISASDTGDSIVAAGDIVAFGTSDLRLKDDVKRIQNPLEMIDKIDGVTFTWNSDSHKSGNDVGVIAQQVNEVLPEICTTRTNGYMAVDYERIVPLLIECIRELKAKL